MLHGIGHKKASHICAVRELTKLVSEIRGEWAQLQGEVKILCGGKRVSKRVRDGEAVSERGNAP